MSIFVLKWSNIKGSSKGEKKISEKEWSNIKSHSNFQKDPRRQFRNTIITKKDNVYHFIMIKQAQNDQKIIL